MEADLLLYQSCEMILQQIIEQPSHMLPGLEMNAISQIAKKLGLAFVPKQEDGNVCFANNNSELRDEYKQTFTIADLQNYIYAVLHSANYKECYKDFLKDDLCKIPYPKNAETFWKLARLGDQIKRTHSLQSKLKNKSAPQSSNDEDNNEANKLLNEINKIAVE